MSAYGETRFPDSPGDAYPYVPVKLAPVNATMYPDVRLVSESWLFAADSPWPSVGFPVPGLLFTCEL